MYVNSLDEIFDSIINKFYIYVKKNQILQKITSDNNFVKYKKLILNFVKKFIENIDVKSIEKIVKTKENLNTIVNLLKRYCGFYLYLGLGYFYKGNRDLFITNLIESGKDQLDITYKIPNLYNSENVSKMIHFFTIIQDVKLIVKERTMERIKILLYKDPIRFTTVIEFLNQLGEEYIIKHFLIDNYFHSLLKTIIFKMIYLKTEKKDIIRLISDKELSDGEYIYIEIEVGNKDKIIDYSVLEKMLSLDSNLKRKIEDIYDFLKDMKDQEELIDNDSKKFKNFIFNQKIFIPITEDFLRYHKDTEKYDPESMLAGDVSIKERDLTKIKYITTKMNKIMNYNSEMLNKNPKLKLNIKKMFYKPLDHLKAILYNDIEEIKIIQKLELSDSSADQDLLIDLESYRKYAYLNFKKFANDGIKLRPDKTIDAIRYVNIKFNDRKRKLDLRVGNPNLSLNVIGLAINFTNLSLKNFKNIDLKNVKEETKNKNGYESTIKILKDIILNKNKIKNNIYYWLFNNETDKAKLSGYKNISKNSYQNINIMIEELYNNFIDIIFDKLVIQINKINNLNIYKIRNLLEYYFENYFTLTDKSIYNKIFKYAYDTIKDIKDVTDPIDTYIPNNQNLIKLPYIKNVKKEKNIIYIDKDEREIIDYKLFKNPPLCLHHLKFKELSFIKNKDPEYLSQRVFNFTKQYVRQNEKGNYVCKSCGEFLKLSKYVFAGTYVKELDVYLTTQVAVNQDLVNIPKYRKLTRTIRNISKNIEKISFLGDITYYLGNENIPKLRRRLSVKEVIDLVIEHTNTIKKLPQNRSELFEKKYGIKKELTNLFFFDLKDEIFLTSSTDTDYYKLIKYNNIIVYILLIIITELNPGQILNLKENKNCNFYLFNKISNILFDGLFIRISVKEKISILKIPLLCYIIYYLSFLVTSYNIWLWNKGENEKGFNINIQKIVINTLVDLINTIRETELEKEKKFLYESLNAKILDKIKYLYSDNNLLERVKEKSNINIKIKDNKVLYISRKVDPISLNGKMNNTTLKQEMFSLCSSNVYIIKGTRKLKINNDINNLTNCLDGRFHIWKIFDGQMKCALCNQSYDKLKKLNETSTENSSSRLLDNIKKIKLSKLSEKYCVSGDLHDIDPKTNKCKLCKKDPSTIKYSDNELIKLQKNIKKKKIELVIKGIELLKNTREKRQKIKNKVSDFFVDLDRNFRIVANDNFINYTKLFSKKIQKILGKQITEKDKKIYLDETIYLLDHDYLGNEKKKVVEIRESENKIKKESNHPFFKKNVLYYLDKSNGYYVFYDAITLVYLGYSNNNKDFNNLRSRSSLKISYSLSRMIELLGYENSYINLSNYEHNLNSEKSNNQIKVSIIRNRVRNLKNILTKVLTIIFSVNNNKSSTVESDLINEFRKKIRNIKMKSDSKEAFKDIFYLLIGNNFKKMDNKLSINRNHLFVSDLNKYDNYDIKILFYLLHNFEILLDLNDNPKNKVQLSYLIVKIIINMFQDNYIKYNLIEIRKFNYYLFLPQAEVNEISKTKDHFKQILNQEEVSDLKPEGYYQELNTDEKDNSEQIMDINEEENALDIDDMNDDIFGDNADEDF